MRYGSGSMRFGNLHRIAGTTASMRSRISGASAVQLGSERPQAATSEGPARSAVQPPGVLLVVLRHPGRADQPVPAERDGRLRLPDAPLHLPDGGQVLVELAAVRPAEPVAQVAGVLGHEIQDAPPLALAPDAGRV